MLRQTAKISKAINPSIMSVGPAGLQCITAHELESKKGETLVRIANMRTDHLTEHIRLATTGGAWTRAPQQFKFQKRFDPVVPGNGQFLSDLLDVGGLQTHLPDHLFGHGFTRTKQGKKHK